MRKLLYGIILLSNFVISCKKVDKLDPMPTPTVKSSAKALLSFSFSKALNPMLDADVNATISGTQVTAIIPNGIDITQLISAFIISDKATAYVNEKEQISTQTINNFTATVSFKIVAENVTENTYQVQINRSGSAPNVNINSTTSYAIFAGTKSYLSIGSITGNINFSTYLARAYYDFDKDGDEDLIAADISGTQSTKNIQYYKKNNGTFIETPQMFTTPKGLVHARKSIVQDFNQDGFMDVAITGHGWDQPPFPGEIPVVLKSNAGASFTPFNLPVSAGFYHSICAGDIDNDGDVDIFLTDNLTVGKFLLNDGQGNFTYDASYYPASLANKNYFTSELYDLNADGYLDLITTGHEQDGAQSIILWGNYTGKYNTSRMTVMPGVTGQGVVIAIVITDINGDGKKDILLNRTSSNPFYQGFYVQLLQNNVTSFSDVTTAMMPQNKSATAQWVDWYRFYDIDNDNKIDIIADNKQFNLIWKNNGSGVFVKQ